MGEHSKDGWAGLGELEEQGEEERLRGLGKEAGEVGKVRTRSRGRDSLGSAWFGGRRQIDQRYCFETPA